MCKCIPVKVLICQAVCLTLHVMLEIFSDVTSSLNSRTTEIKAFSTTVVDRLTSDPFSGRPAMVKGSLDRLTFSPSSG